MIDGDAVVEAALLVEVDNILDRVRRCLLAHVIECAAVTQTGEPRAFALVEAEEPADAKSVKTMPLTRSTTCPPMSTRNTRVCSF